MQEVFPKSCIDCLNIEKCKLQFVDSFEYFIKTYGAQLKAIRFFKNKLVEDWSLLGTLHKLEYIHFFLLCKALYRKEYHKSG